MSGIFISYRRGETGAIAGRIADRLSERFGADKVFMDVDAIRPGVDFVERIQEAVGACDVLVAVIGPDWVTDEHPSGHRRIDDPNDFVVLEVAAGLERDVLVIPVLVQGAVMPSADQLPPRLAGLARRNALQASDLRFRDDIGHLIEAIETVMPTPARSGESPPPRRSGRRRSFIVLGALVVLVAAGVAAIATSSGSGSRSTSTSGSGIGSTSSRPPKRGAPPGSTTSGSATQVPPGSYSGLASGYAVTFYVSADRQQIQDVTVSSVPYTCSPGGSNSDPNFGIAAIAIAPNGSFTATTTQSGIISDSPARITYTFSGHFEGTTPSGTEGVAGTLREDSSYNDGIAHSCTSGDGTWSATHDNQGVQTVSQPPPGRYSGLAEGNAVTFYVSADRKQLQNITLSSVPYGCSPGGRNSDSNFGIATIAVAPDGSFSSTTTRSGAVSGSPAQLTYTFSGHFHGFSTSGVARLAGQLREDVTYNNGTAYTCTSNNLPWSATHT